MVKLTVVEKQYQPYPFITDMSVELAIAYHTRTLSDPSAFGDSFIEGVNNVVGITTLMANERRVHPPYESTVVEVSSINVLRGMCRALCGGNRRVVDVTLIKGGDRDWAAAYTESSFETMWEEAIFHQGASIHPPLSVVPKT